MKTKKLTNSQKQTLRKFDEKFEKDNGSKVEPSFKDPNGDVGPVKQFLLSELSEAKHEVINDLLALFDDYNNPILMKAEYVRDQLIKYSKEEL